MANSIKSLVLLSTSLVSYTSYSFFFTPNCAAVYNNLIAPLVTVYSLVVSSLPELKLEASAEPAKKLALFVENTVTEAQSAQLLRGISALEVLSGLVIYMGFSLIVILLLSSLLSMTGLTHRFTRIKSAIVTAVFPSLTFLNSAEVTVTLLFLFLTLYFLEVHFFFIFSLSLSSDSLVYQFNFLLSGFLFVFLVKF